jgi:hypothetical protein
MHLTVQLHRISIADLLHGVQHTGPGQDRLRLLLHLQVHAARTLLRDSHSSKDLHIGFQHYCGMAQDPLAVHLPHELAKNIISVYK